MIKLNQLLLILKKMDMSTQIIRLIYLLIPCIPTFIRLIRKPVIKKNLLFKN